MSTIEIVFLCLRKTVRLKIVTDLTHEDSIRSAAILSSDGFVIERAGDVFNYDAIFNFIEIEDKSGMLTIITEENTIIIAKIGDEIVCLVCGIGVNLGKIRIFIDNVIQEISQLQ